MQLKIKIHGIISGRFNCRDIEQPDVPQRAKEDVQEELGRALGRRDMRKAREKDSQKQLATTVVTQLCLQVNAGSHGKEKEHRGNYI